MNHRHPTLDTLRPVYKHFRYYHNGRSFGHYRKGVTDWTPDSHGGLTRCYLYNSDGWVVAVGEAFCSFSDQFRYSMGRMISRGRAQKAVLEALTVEEGYAVWECEDGVQTRWADRELVKKL